MELLQSSIMTIQGNEIKQADYFQTSIVTVYV